MATDDVAALAPETMLLVALAVTVGMQFSFFAVAFTCQIDKVTDLAGTLNFLVLAVLSLVVQGLFATRAVVVTALVGVWALRLGAHLLLRVLRRGKDARFDEMRANCVSFLGFWVFQIVWVFVISLPVVLANSSDAFQQEDAASGHAFGQAQDVVGLALWAIGFALEWAADANKERFYQDKANRGKLLCSGVWRYSRHPNYFGEILCWVGVTIVASVTFTGAQQWFYVSVLSPLLTCVLLLFLSGIPMAEERYDERFGLQPLYLDYKSSTSPLVCLPPALYRRLPMAVKRTLLFEFPMYSRKLREIQRQQKEEAKAAQPSPGVARSSSAVVAPMQPMLYRLALEAKQSSIRVMHQLSLERRQSIEHAAHKAMVQRFQLRRVSTDVAIQDRTDPSVRHRASSLMSNSISFVKNKSASLVFAQRLRRALRRWGRGAVARLQQPIAPDGRLQQVRELALLLAFALQILYFPFVAAYARDNHAYSPASLHVAFETVFVVDLLLAFNTAYYAKDSTAALVASRPDIARRYLRSWFVVDLLAAIPFQSIEILARRGDATEQEAHGAFAVALLTRLPKLAHQLNVEPTLAAIRTFRATRQFWMWLQYSRYSHLLRILRLVVGVLTTAHYMACTWELLRPRSVAGDDTERAPFAAYATNFYYSMLLLQGEASTPGVATVAQNAYNIACVMLGSLVLAVVFGNVAMLVANFYANSTSYQRKMERVFDTMRKMELPYELRDRVHQYYEHLWLEYECLDGDIVHFSKRLTHSLAVEVGLFQYLELVASIRLWKTCSPAFLTHVVLSLDVRVYLPDDYVVRKGETGEQLFMINKGTCELVQLVRAMSSSTGDSAAGLRGGTGASTSRAATNKTSSSSASFRDANVSDSEDEADDIDDGDEEQTCYRFRQGEAFGELALLMNYRRTTSVRAVGYVEMCILSRSRFQQVLFKYPDDRRKVLVALLKQSIATNVLQGVAYPWQELLAGAKSAPSASTPPPGAASKHKVSGGNRRCVAMFGDNWTVGDVATALAAKIDVEHPDESIVFGFQAADLRPNASTPHQNERQLQSGERESRSELAGGPASVQSCESTTGRSKASARPSLSREPQEAIEDAATPRRHRRTSSSSTDNGELLAARVLTQSEAAKTRLRSAESAHTRIRESLATLAQSLEQLDAVAGGRASEPAAPHRSAASRQGKQPSCSPAVLPHRRSVAGHEHRVGATAAASRRRGELRRVVTHGVAATAQRLMEERECNV